MLQTHPVQIVGATGSVAGVDPMDAKSWSGSSASLFGELRRRGRLKAAWGVRAPPLTRALLMAKTIHPNRSVWRMRLGLEPAHRDALTRALAKRLTGLERPADLLQIGAYFDGAAAVAGRGRAFSYHDGNMALRLASPYPMRGASPRMAARVMAYERAAAQNCALVFTMSEWLRRSFIHDYGLRPERVVAVGGAANFADPPPQPDPDKDYSAKEIAFVGVDFARKGGALLIEAFRAVRARWPTAMLHVAGPPADLVPKEPGVAAHGFVGRDDIRALFARSSLFVMPSLYEPFGIAPIEAMACGLPAVVTGSWALAETVLDGRTGAHVRRNDVDHLAETLIDLLSAPDRLKIMGAAARADALANFTWEAVVDRMDRAIASAA